MAIFLDDEDYRKCVYLIGDVLERFSIRCWNYCVMPNHYHLTLEPQQATVSDAIRRLNGTYAQWWNRRHDRVGHVFQGRFKEQIVDRESYLMSLSRYVVMNPVRAGLVQRPEDWRWSSYRATVGWSTAPSFLDVDSTLRLFGQRPAPDLMLAFAHYVNSSPDAAAADRIRSAEHILGSRAFKEAIGTPEEAATDIVD
jgi:REP element-mobilizing transposase RayT